MDGRSGLPSASTGRQPIICPLKLTAAISAAFKWRRDSSARVEVHTACHQSSAFCSAQVPLKNRTG